MSAKKLEEPESQWENPTNKPLRQLYPPSAYKHNTNAMQRVIWTRFFGLLLFLFLMWLMSLLR
jgi:Fe2+ transport system protein B